MTGIVRPFQAQPRITRTRILRARILLRILDTRTFSFRLTHCTTPRFLCYVDTGTFPATHYTHTFTILPYTRYAHCLPLSRMGSHTGSHTFTCTFSHSVTTTQCGRTAHAHHAAHCPVVRLQLLFTHTHGSHMVTVWTHICCPHTYTRLHTHAHTHMPHTVTYRTHTHILQHTVTWITFPHLYTHLPLFCRLHTTRSVASPIVA